MNAIPWYRSQVLMGAVVSIISQGLVLLGKGDLISPEVLTSGVQTFFEFIAILAAGWALIARARSKVQPVTLKADSAGQPPPALFIGLLLVPLLMTLAACAGARMAYKAADTPEEYAYVVTEHYAAVLRQAAELRSTGRLTGERLEAVQRADNRVAPLVLGLEPLRQAFQEARTAENELALQAAVDRAVLALAALVREIRAAVAGPTGFHVEQQQLRVVWA